MSVTPWRALRHLRPLGLRRAQTRRCGHQDQTRFRRLCRPRFSGVSGKLFKRKADRYRICPFQSVVRAGESPSTHVTLADVVVFHAGTTRSDDKVVTSGGRVLAVSAHAETIQAALDAAYSAIENIQFDGKTFRRDIAHRLF